MILSKKIITPEQADELILKYYEGKTTCSEEDMLKYFLNQKNLPPKYDVEKQIFGYFETKIKAKSKLILFRPLYRSAAAAIIVILVGFTFYKNVPQNRNYAYVNGEKITNVEQINSIANRSLSDISSENDQVVENQLNQFSNIGF